MPQNELEVFALLAFLMIGPSVIFLIIALIIRKRKPKIAKVLYVLAGIYVLISGGICGSLIVGFRL